MSLKDIFSKDDFKRDYAQEFKDAFENQDIGKILEVMEDWKGSNIDDANFGLALIIIGSLSGNVDFTETFELYLQIVQDKPDNPQLFDWFSGTALNLLEKICDDEIGFSEMFNNEYKSKRPSNDYAVEFLRVFEDIVENDNDRLNDLKSIVGKWEDDCPEDANMHCAYVILNVFDLSEDELNGRVKKAEEFTPADKNSYARLLALMRKVCMAK